MKRFFNLLFIVSFVNIHTHVAIKFRSTLHEKSEKNTNENEYDLLNWFVNRREKRKRHIMIDEVRNFKQHFISPLARR